jgi:hypothetical protein
MTLRLNNITDDERLDVWRRVIKRIADEQGRQAWSHFMFRLLRAVYMKNDRLSTDGGYILNWMAQNYVDAALMLVRRELDQQAGTENLRNLLIDIIEYPSVLTRARYKAGWNQDRFLYDDIRDRAFDKFNPKRVDGNPSADYIDPKIVGADLQQVIDDAENLREYAERTRAHRTPQRNISQAEFTFAELHKTIEDVRNTVSNYHSLITLDVITNWEPVPQFNTMAPFMYPWIEDAASVQAAMDDEISENR